MGNKPSSWRRIRRIRNKDSLLLMTLTREFVPLHACLFLLTFLFTNNPAHHKHRKQEKRDNTGVRARLLASESR